MKIVRRVAINASESRLRELSLIGIEVTPTARGTILFEIPETDRRWVALNGWLKQNDLLLLAPEITYFSDADRQDAEWLVLRPEWHYGYPQPNPESFGFLRATYDPTAKQYCGHCGTGKVQIRPFQLKSEPKWGRRNILQLNWVFDEYFLTPELWEACRPFGVKARPVVDRREDVLQSVVQLDIKERVRILDTSRLEAVPCSVCGTVKFAPFRRGYFPSIERPSGHIAKTHEYFGSGGRAFQAVLVSQELRRALLKAGARGCTFDVVENRVMG